MKLAIRIFQILTIFVVGFYYGMNYARYTAEAKAVKANQVTKGDAK